MDNLHGVLRTLHPERKSDGNTESKAADHLSVFRDFLSHLDKISRQTPKPPRAKAASSRPVKRKTKR